MKRILSVAVVMLLTVLNVSAQNNTKGYYRDILIDGGIGLSSKWYIPATIYLDLTKHTLLSVKDDKDYSSLDTLYQNSVFIGNEYDENGYLLYPDGAPRFRVLYVNGGSSFSHGRSVGEEGRKNIMQFILNGGSYVGTCAGSALSSKGVIWDNGFRLQDDYFAIWPGVIRRSEASRIYTGMNIPKKSPLLRYYDFGGDLHLDSLYHNLGNHAYRDLDWPAGTEILATYETDTLNLERKIGGEPSIWAYRPTANSGREVMCGSHPESIPYGERLHLMSAMLRYAMDGNGYPSVKAELLNNEERVMDRSTHDNQPELTKIGDRQYHHFLVKVPKKTKSLRITLTAVPDQPKDSTLKEPDLFLFARRGKFAYKGESEFQNLKDGIGKVIEISKPKAGDWYISVFCDTTVEAEETTYGTRYTGRLDVLNGVPYIIKVEY